MTQKGREIPRNPRIAVPWKRSNPRRKKRVYKVAKQSQMDVIIRNAAAKQTKRSGEFPTGKANLQLGVLGIGKNKQQQRGGETSEIARLTVH